MRTVAIIDGCRTPFQRISTGFGSLLSYQLASAVIGGLVERNSVPKDAVDQVIFGATVSNPRTTNVAREAALDAGLAYTVPAWTLTVAGASATAAIARGVELISLGRADVVIAGGTDCISDPPIGFSRVMRTKLLAARRAKTLGAKLRFALGLRPIDFLPEIPDITEFSTGETMGQYTEALAQKLGISRAEQDAYAAESHRRARAAVDYLSEEIVAVQTSSGPVVSDNGIRESSVEELALLPPSFAERGTLTAGNSSYLTDGAAGVLLMSEDRARTAGLEVQALVRGYALTAHDPHRELLLGPVYATPLALADADVAFELIDVFEMHEAFAAQMLAVTRLFAGDAEACRVLGVKPGAGELPPAQTNAWGGSLAIGNPFAPNGARLVTTAMHRLRHEGARLALVATCAGGGLGSAMVLERPS